MSEERRAPPGWYLIPGREGDYRYWDGQRWSAIWGSNIPGNVRAPMPLGTSDSFLTRAVLVLLSAAVTLVVVALLIPWAHLNGKRGAFHGDLPWRFEFGGVADTWFVGVMGVVLLLCLLAVIIGLPLPWVRWAAILCGVLLMAFCVGEATPLHDDIVADGGTLGPGLLVTFAAGALSAAGGALRVP